MSRASAHAASLPTAPGDRIASVRECSRMSPEALRRALSKGTDRTAEDTHMDNLTRTLDWPSRPSRSWSPPSS